MQDQMTFQRYELKYLLSARQFRSVLDAMQPHMVPDVYRHSSIRNLYLDAADFRLIRRSLERPVYKEKLRVRSYGRTGAYDPVFVEIKKKYASVVCKRRISLPQEQAMACLAAHQPWPDTQIGRELGYITGFYRSLRPAVFLSYERDAFCGVEDRELRVTFDTEIRYRQTVLTLDSDTGGPPGPAARPGTYGIESDRGRPAMDGPFSVRAENFQDIVFKIRRRLPGHPDDRAQGGTEICLTKYSADCLTAPRPASSPPGPFCSAWGSRSFWGFCFAP